MAKKQKSMNFEDDDEPQFTQKFILALEEITSQGSELEID